MRIRGRVGANRRGVALIAGGTGLGQLVIVGASPILSRIYQPSAFGLLATFTALSGLLAIVSAARLEMVIPVARTDDEARRVVGSALSLSLLVGALGSLLMWLFAGHIAAALDQPSLSHWLWLLPLSATAAASFMVLNQWAVRRAQFASIGLRNTIRSVTTVLVQTLSGAAGLRPGGTVVGFTVGHAAGALAMLPGSGLRARTVFSGFGQLWSVLRSYRSTCTMLTLSGLLNVAGTQVPVLLFATWFTVTEVGWLGFTQRTLTLPVGLVGTAVAQVYVSIAAQAARDGRDLRPLFSKVSRQLGAVGILGALVLGLGGPTLFEIFFGAPWREAGEYARWLSVAIAMQLLAVPLSQTLIVAGRTGMQLLWDIGRALAVCAAMAMAVAFGADALTTVKVLGFTQGATYLIQWLMCRWVITHWSVRPLGDESDDASLDSP